MRRRLKLNMAKQGAPFFGAPCRDCRKSGVATFSRKNRCVLRLCCPLIADNSTLTPRKVFSATHMSRQKTNYAAFASADAKLCEAFFDMLNMARRFTGAPCLFISIHFPRVSPRDRRTAPHRSAGTSSTGGSSRTSCRPCAARRRPREYTRRR